jgi:hypothetical protein
MRRILSTCPSCGKYILPPGMIIMVQSQRALELFCQTQGECVRIECTGCGYYVNPFYHSQWECQQFVRWWGYGHLKETSLNERDVLAEAEAILRESHEQK